MTSAIAPSSDQRRVALFIDGENVPSTYAGRIITRSRIRGELALRRVYGGVRKIPGWDAAPGFRLIHTGSGKNGADLMLAIEAMAFSYEGLADVFVLVSSDGDFTHLAQNLRERGFTVIGMGEEKAPATFRKACHEFDELKPIETVATANVSLVAKVKATISEAGGEMLISQLGPKMWRDDKVRISAEPEKTWRKFLAQRQNIFLCDPKGPDAKVRLRG